MKRRRVRSAGGGQNCFNGEDEEGKICMQQEKEDSNVGDICSRFSKQKPKGFSRQTELAAQLKTSWSTKILEGPKHGRTQSNV